MQYDDPLRRNPLQNKGGVSEPMNPGFQVIFNGKQQITEERKMKKKLISSLVVVMTLAAASIGLAADGLVGHWTFDETSGTLAADASGNGNNGFLRGAAAWIPGKVGAGALKFDGKKSYVAVPHNASLEFTDKMTCAAWIKVASTAGGQDVLQKNNYAMGEIRAGKGMSNVLHIGSTWHIYPYKESAAGWVGTWHHIAFTYDGAHVVNYLDGKADTTFAQTGTIAQSTDSLGIGINSPWKDSSYNGEADDVRLYNVALNASEIQALAGEGAGPEFPPTLAHNKGPFPMGTELVRNDAPVDATDPSPSGVIHEYTAYQGTPVVDGDVTDAIWESIPWTPMEWHISFPNTANTGDLYDSGYTPENWDGWTDITAWFKVLWDKDFVYVATRKVDDNYSYLTGTDTNTGDIWQNDAFQIHMDARPAGNFDAVAPGSEIGFCLVEGMEVYNWWSGALASDRQLELADGNNTSGSESCLGKAIIGKQEDTDTGYTETIEMAFNLWPEVTADESEMFSIMVLDRDYDTRDCGLQWAQGIYVKTQDKYGSILWSSKAPPSTAVEDKAGKHPDAFMLNQNFPNPFNPATMISYRLLRSDQVKLEVFDISGRLVAVLADEKQGAGYHSASFDAKGLNSGTYLCRLKAGSSVAIKKMLFVK
jgi:hypothetical protein